MKTKRLSVNKKLIRFILAMYERGSLPSVNLNECKFGDLLLTCHGTILKYVEKTQGKQYPHLIQYPEGSQGTRTDDGFAFQNKRLPADENVIAILG